MLRDRLPLSSVLCLLALWGCGGSAEPQTTAAASESAGAERPADGEEAADGLAVAGLRGTLSQDEIRMALEPRMLKFAHCVAKRTAHVETLAGSVSLAFLVKVDGRVGSVHLTDSDVGDRAAERCILKVARKARFPAPHGGEAEFTWSFEVPLDPEVRPAVPWTADDVASVLAERAAEVTGQCGSGFKVTAYIATDGSVLGAGAASEAQVDEAALDCVAEAVAGWVFPSPGSYPAKVSFEL